MSYGNDRVSEWRQVAIYVDRIFKGEKPLAHLQRIETAATGPR
jgi:hypothetical protein